MDSFLFDDLDGAQKYKLLVTAVHPRPIAWVSTMDAHGVQNLAPFSFFNIVSADPPILGFSPIIRASGDEPRKDTLRNIRDTGECVIHVVPYSLLQQMNRTSASVPPDVDEIEFAELTPVKSQLVRPVRIAEAPIAFECKLEQILSWGDGPRAGQFVLVRVLLMHVRDGLVQDLKIDPDQLDLVGRLGGPFYTRASVGMESLQRPDDQEASK